MRQVILATLIFHSMASFIFAKKSIEYTATYQNYNAKDMDHLDSQGTIGGDIGTSLNLDKKHGLLNMGASIGVYNGQDKIQEDIDCMCFPNYMIDERTRYFINLNIGYKYHLTSLIDNRLNLYLSGLYEFRGMIYEKKLFIYETGPIDDRTKFSIALGVLNLKIGIESRYAIKESYGFLTQLYYSPIRGEGLSPNIGAGLGVYHSFGISD